MACISQPMCSPAYVEPKLIDVRVPMGAQQMALYAHFMTRCNIDAKTPLVRARKQITYLRNICADPMRFSHGGPKVTSNFNPKTVAMLELAPDIMVKGDQFVVICARKVRPTRSTPLCATPACCAPALTPPSRRGSTAIRPTCSSHTRPRR